MSLGIAHLAPYPRHTQKQKRERQKHEEQLSRRNAQQAQWERATQSRLDQPQKQTTLNEDQKRRIEKKKDEARRKADIRRKAAMDSSDNSVVVVKVENPFKRKLEDTELELAVTERKARRISGVVDSIADNWLCPITLELPIDPVMAEDGKIYERSAIEQWLRTKRTSPSTNNPMGGRLFPAPQAKSTIEALVKSGEVSDDKAKAWKAKLKNEKKVKKWREAAEGGDADAIFQLGRSYQNGEYGLPKDLKQAREWYKRGAELGNVKCMGNYGLYLLRGLGGDVVNALGMFYTSRAVQGGYCSSYLLLGRGFAEGSYGLPQDTAQARVWLTKVITEDSYQRRIGVAEALLAKLPPIHA
jgi:hypothetical protein